MMDFLPGLIHRDKTLRGNDKNAVPRLSSSRKETKKKRLKKVRKPVNFFVGKRQNSP